MTMDGAIDFGVQFIKDLGRLFEPPTLEAQARKRKEEFIKSVALRAFGILAGGFAACCFYGMLVVLPVSSAGALTRLIIGVACTILSHDLAVTGSNIRTILKGGEI